MFLLSNNRSGILFFSWWLCNILTPVQQRNVRGVRCYLTVIFRPVRGSTELVVETAIQHVVGDGGQKVITIVTEEQGKLQPAGRQSEWAVTPPV